MIRIKQTQWKKTLGNMKNGGETTEDDSKISGKTQNTKEKNNDCLVSYEENIKCETSQNPLSMEPLVPALKSLPLTDSFLSTSTTTTLTAMETSGGWINHVYRFNQVIQKATKRGLPIDKEALDKLGVELDNEKLRLQEEIKDLLSKREEEKGTTFWGYKTEDNYLVLPKILREECKLRGTEVTTVKRKKNKDTGKFEKVEVTEIVPASYCEEGAKYPCREEQYEQWFWDFAIEAGFEWVESEWDEELRQYTSHLVAKESFNPASPAQLKDYCYWMNYSIPLSIKKTSKGREEKESTDDKALEELIEQTGDKMFSLIQDFREVNKLRTTYCGKLQSDGTVIGGWQPHRNGRLHPTFKFTTATGQLASENPNVQNLPKGGKYGDKLRSCVKAGEGKLLYECVDPETKVLMRDLTWKRAGSIKVGEELLGFDEFPVSPNNRRYFRPSRVEHREIRGTNKVKVVTDKGEIIVAATHKFLRRVSGKAAWVIAKDLKPGQTIRYFTKPWETLDTYEAGWLAGFLDGEGYCGNGGGNKSNGFKNTGLGFGQNDGLAAEKAKEIFAKYGYVLSQRDFGKYKCKQYNVLSKDTPYAWLRAIAQFRPVRLLDKTLSNVNGMATWGKASTGAIVKAVEEVGYGAVVSLSTSTKTLITEGFMSHNCDYSGYHALMLGYFANDPEYMRLSRYGIHDFLAAHMLRGIISRMKAKDLESDLWQETIDHISNLDQWLSHDDFTLKTNLKWIKSNHKSLRDKKAKPIAHSMGFGAGVRGIYEKNKSSFGSEKEVKGIRDIYYQLFPKIRIFQDTIIKKAHEEKRLINPYGRVRRFWEAMIWDSKNRCMKKGDEAEAAVAFLPASTAFAVKTEALLRLEVIGANERFNYILDVHDSGVWEIWERDLEEAYYIITGEMARPVKRLAHPVLCPDGLICDLEASVGKDWGSMKEIKL